MIQVVASAAATRVEAALDFIGSVPAGTELLLLGASRDAIDDLVRVLSARDGATFGLHRFTLTQLAARLAAPALSAAGQAPCTHLGAEAVAARATFEALAQDRIPFFAPVARCPGFARTLAASLAELRAAGIDTKRLAAAGTPADQLATLLAAYGEQLERARLNDRPALLRAAADAVAAAEPDALVGLPLLLFDVPVDTRGERDLLAALCAASPRVLATVPSGDDRTLNCLRQFPLPQGEGQGEGMRPSAAGAQDTSLARVQTFLFAKEDPSPATPDDTVRFFSAPGEARETVEIARAALAEARAGRRFDQMAVLLRNPETYTPLLETAFRRAGVPAYFARGTRRPNPAGRAFLALLACAADRLSATRFAEYLSFGQVPELAPTGAPPEGRAVWAGPRDDTVGATAAASDSLSREGEGEGEGERNVQAPSDRPHPGPLPRGRGGGSLPAPWKWEELLVDAAVIGGAERWVRRLDGLERELELRHQALASDDPGSPRLAATRRDLANLGELRRFALPLIETLAQWPASARWGEWRERFVALAARSLRRPEPVLQVLAELAPMAEVGPVGLDEVRNVLTPRLNALTDDPPRYRHGRVLVTTLDDARGRAFDIVFAPGLAERVFPQRPREDPLLLDAARRELAADLPTSDDRIARERLLLRLAVGAATTRMYLSYPRVDVVQGRPRVTSFYGLDVARATHGSIPDIEMFEREAEAVFGARLAWPAPPDPAAAIDAAEHDLATLAALIHAPPDGRAKGAAQYLLDLNPHLGRSLRTRFARWELRRWTELDGITRTSKATAALLAGQRLTARPYSPSALEQFAVCPYRFFLAAIQRLEPRAEAAALEQLDPLTRGQLVHRVQAETLRALAAGSLLPLASETLAGAERVLTDTLAAVAARFHDDLAPPILRVWQDEIAALRGDLITWLRHLAEHGAAWHPIHFEYGFGLPGDEGRDPDSRTEPVVLFDGLRLRGSVDLVERRPDGSELRVTDHKTGADRTTAGLLVGGGEVLQPVLYGLAVEAALGVPMHEARLFYCTSRGGFSECVVPIDARARAAGRQVLEQIDRAIADGFLPPAPRQGACGRCDFRLVCGPYEEERLRRKDPAPLAGLLALRQRP